MFFEPYMISLIGHRYIEDCHLQDRLEVIVRELIDTHEYVEFMIGRNGDFDLMAASAIKTVQKNHRDDNSCLCLVLPYPVADMEYYEDYYNEVILIMGSTSKIGDNKTESVDDRQFRRIDSLC